MLYTNDLDRVVFEGFDDKDDELVIISGWLGSVQVEKIIQSGRKIKALYGMSSNSGVPGPNHSHLKHLDLTEDHLEVYYSLPGNGVHSKIYVWKSKGKITKALIGSANFTYQGLYTPDRESLITIQPEDFEILEKYISFILGGERVERCTNPKLKTKISNIRKALNLNPRDLIIRKDSLGAVETIRMSFVNKRGKLPPGASGLNWGQGEKAHTCSNDAYIKISATAIRTGFFKAKSYERLEGVELKKAKKYRIPVEVIWDDGTAMDILEEGNQEINGIQYPKQIASAYRKDIFGLYIRKRLGVSPGEKITLEHLKAYGRTYVDITRTGENQYYMNFSKIEKK